ncbi:hypothetical protein [Corynebacterium pseudopelargi]|uniref:Uncharacterized protein n=1 Tax=Corynebacterium pseudopelargi TaxID=2080757 RepID=A0A3G6IXD3_9CORY|nr:hypothetical protein [Corynebacterium pseudopelargi]AZA08790.1 hypothetical protein CPPEL_03295 [Corynebacterium pseudopelargi]
MWEWLTDLGDRTAQFLTTSPLWLQVTLVIAVAVPLCAVLALLWLRVVDRVGSLLARGGARARARAQAKVSLDRMTRNDAERVASAKHGEP